MSSQRREDDVNLTNTASDTPGKTYNLENVGGYASTKNKWKSKLLSASFWNMTIVISCVIAISLDPLFFYIPFIDEKKKCIGMDKKLRNGALILRSLTDITFLVDIGYQIYTGIHNAYKEINQGKAEWELDWQTTLIRRDEIIPFAKILARELTWCSLVTDFLSVFPMPQLLVAFLFFDMRGPEYIEWSRVVNFFLLGQYLPRIYRIILSSRELIRTAATLVKALFNFFLYILASHVLGALWYFFSVQRMTSCWYSACDKEDDRAGCMSTLFCGDDHNTSYSTIFNNSCRMVGPDDKEPPFDYGIFRESLKIGNSGRIHFPTKLCYCFWWGLKNLSNFGTNLNTSNYVWENLFAILISVTGLLLFIYLIGNVQTFNQMRTQKFVEIRHKIDSKKGEIEKWMEEYGIPDNMKKQVVKDINKKWEDDKDADMKNPFNVLKDNTKKSLKYDLCLKILSKVPLLQLMDDKVLKMMCDCLAPVTYEAEETIFRDHLIDHMLLIMKGTVLLIPSKPPNPRHTRGLETTEDSGSPSMTFRELGKGDVYGQELLKWLSDNNLPTCSENVKCHTKVEGFVLSKKDLEKVSECKRWKLNFDAADP